MGRNAHQLIFLFLLLVVAVCAYRYYDYVIQQHYTILANTACDPRTEACFLSDCDPAVVGCDEKPYEKVVIEASVAPACVEEHTCTNFSCPQSDRCAITYCDETTIAEGEYCVGTAAP